MNKEIKREKPITPDFSKIKNKWYYCEIREENNKLFYYVDGELAYEDNIITEEN